MSNTPLNQTPSGMISPGYQSIIHSARREAAVDLNFEIGGTMSQSGVSLMKLASQGAPITIPPSPRRKNSNALLYGNSQYRSRMRLQLQNTLEANAFRDKVTVQQDAVKLIREATRKMDS